jgi:hypothetical protein
MIREALVLPKDPGLLRRPLGFFSLAASRNKRVHSDFSDEILSEDWIIFNDPGSIGLTQRPWPPASASVLFIFCA